MMIRTKRHIISLLGFGLGIAMIGSVSLGNERCNIVVTQPVSSNLLSQTRPANITLQAEFRMALGNALTNRLPSGAGVGDDLMAAMIADYVDTDSIPKRLNMPSTEMVPMVSQILVPSYMAPIVIKRTFSLPGPPPNRKDIYSVQLVGDPAAVRLDVELVWPFKNQKGRTPQHAFKVEVQAYLKVIKVHDPKKTQGFMEPPAAFIPLTGSIAIPDFWSKDTYDPAICYTRVSFPLTTPDVSKLTVDIIDNKDGVIPGSGFVEHSPFSVALVVFAYVRLGTDIVDSVPQLTFYPGFDDPVTEFIGTPKIFFQTVASPPVEKVMEVNLPIPYEWSSLEIPDPRFNYKASNWVKNTADVNVIMPKINPSTVALLGKDGRDGDIYMAVSDAGILHSPGELGFIVRPYPQNPAGVNTDYRTQDSADNAEEKDYMFRTIRLYDHGSPTDLVQRARDLVYENFTSKNPDGTMTGARVNPRSDLPQVLVSAVQDTPVDYYWAKKKSEGLTPVVFSKTLDSASWGSFKNGWLNCLQNAKAVPPFNISLASKLSDVYGRHDLFGWYSNGDPCKVFAGGYMTPGVPANLTVPLHEIDRKMLYSYSLDNFKEPGPFLIYMIYGRIP